MLMQLPFARETVVVPLEEYARDHPDFAITSVRLCNMVIDGVSRIGVHVDRKLPDGAVPKLPWDHCLMRRDFFSDLPRERLIAQGLERDASQLVLADGEPTPHAESALALVSTPVVKTTAETALDSQISVALAILQLWSSDDWTKIKESCFTGVCGKFAGLVSTYTQTGVGECVKVAQTWDFGLGSVKRALKVNREWTKTKFKHSRLIEITDDFLKAEEFLVFAGIEVAPTMVVLCNRCRFFKAIDSDAELSIVHTALSDISEKTADAFKRHHSQNPWPAGVDKVNPDLWLKSLLTNALSFMWEPLQQPERASKKVLNIIYQDIRLVVGILENVWRTKHGLDVSGVLADMNAYKTCLACALPERANVPAATDVTTALERLRSKELQGLYGLLQDCELGSQILESATGMVTRGTEDSLGDSKITTAIDYLAEHGTPAFIASDVHPDAFVIENFASIEDMKVVGILTESTTAAKEALMTWSPVRRLEKRWDLQQWVGAVAELCAIVDTCIVVHNVRVVNYEATCDEDDLFDADGAGGSGLSEAIVAVNAVDQKWDFSGKADVAKLLGEGSIDETAFEEFLDMFDAFIEEYREDFGEGHSEAARSVIQRVKHNLAVRQVLCSLSRQIGQITSSPAPGSPQDALREFMEFQATGKASASYISKAILCTERFKALEKLGGYQSPLDEKEGVSFWFTKSNFELEDEDRDEDPAHIILRERAFDAAKNISEWRVHSHSQGFLQQCLQSVFNAFLASTEKANESAEEPDLIGETLPSGTEPLWHAGAVLFNVDGVAPKVSNFHRVFIDNSQSLPCSGLRDLLLDMVCKLGLEEVDLRTEHGSVVFNYADLKKDLDTDCWVTEVVSGITYALSMFSKSRLLENAGIALGVIRALKVALAACSMLNRDTGVFAELFGDDGSGDEEEPPQPPLAMWAASAHKLATTVGVVAIQAFIDQSVVRAAAVSAATPHADAIISNDVYSKPLVQKQLCAGWTKREVFMKSNIGLFKDTMAVHSYHKGFGFPGEAADVYKDNMKYINAVFAEGRRVVQISAAANIVQNLTGAIQCTEAQNVLSKKQTLPQKLVDALTEITTAPKTPAKERKSGKK
jgi:hypothetical protein